jgi:LysM repeat protein
MSGIAAQFDVTVTELIAANPQIPDPDRLAIGDVLTIPATGAPGSASPSASAAASSPLP